MKKVVERLPRLSYAVPRHDYYIKQTTLKQSDDFESFSFGIKESGLSHIFNVLRNQLYSDKVLAVIREYSTNAVDAHIEVGQADKPIKVTLPTQMTPEFKVRDFGRGLTEEQAKGAEKSCEKSHEIALLNNNSCSFIK